MAGEQSCEWATWFKAHYENYDKAPSDFDSVKWNVEHTLQLRRLRLERGKLGERVFLEGENAIRLTLPSGVVLAAKLDLITRPSEMVIVGEPELITPPDVLPTGDDAWQPKIYDVKTGKERCSDRIQVMLSMHFVPQAIPEYARTRPAGCVVYNGSKVDIPSQAGGREVRRGRRVLVGCCHAHENRDGKSNHKPASRNGAFHGLLPFVVLNLPLLLKVKFREELVRVTEKI
jgi:hypothetical protein